MIASQQAAPDDVASQQDESDPQAEVKIVGADIEVQRSNDPNCEGEPARRRPEVIGCQNEKDRYPKDSEQPR